MDKANERKPLRIKNLAELKRTIKPGVEMLTISHAYHKDMIGLIRQVKQVQTVGFYSVIKDQPNHHYSVCNYGKGFFTAFEKASAYIFNGDTITQLNTRKNDGSILMTFAFYEQEQKQVIESEETNMNEYERLHRLAGRHRETYPPGTRIMLLHMGNDPRPIEPNTRGTVRVVDDIGTLHCDFDNGRSLGIVPGEDSFRKLTDAELVEERMEKLPHINGKLTAFCTDVGKSFMGYSTEHRWNGWECPLFPKESADEIQQYYNNEYCSMRYDEETDQYIANNPQYDSSEQYEGQDYVVNGKVERLYAIGSHEWCWDTAEQEENQGVDESEDNSPVMGM